jgi:peptidoglycan/xylan/chitin deacetylase (PgdA/CDA1 family)
MQRAEDAIASITGASTRPLWRAPFGARNTAVMNAVSAIGWTVHVYWTADSGDWMDISPAQVRANLNSNARNGAILIQHCGSTQSAAITRDAIIDLKTKGYRLVTVSELLRD